MCCRYNRVQKSREERKKKFEEMERCVLLVARRTSHVTRYTSHVTRHTSHVTRHMLHVTRHTSHVTRHTPTDAPKPRPENSKRKSAGTHPTLFPHIQNVTLYDKKCNTIRSRRAGEDEESEASEDSDDFIVSDDDSAHHR